MEICIGFNFRTVKYYFTLYLLLLAIFLLQADKYFCCCSIDRLLFGRAGRGLQLTRPHRARNKSLPRAMSSRSGDSADSWVPIPMSTLNICPFFNFCLLFIYFCPFADNLSLARLGFYWVGYS